MTDSLILLSTTCGQHHSLSLVLKLYHEIDPQFGYDGIPTIVHTIYHQGLETRNI